MVYVIKRINLNGLSQEIDKGQPMFHFLPGVDSCPGLPADNDWQ